jgi:hypothetical protein
MCHLQVPLILVDYGNHGSYHKPWYPYHAPAKYTFRSGLEITGES